MAGIVSLETMCDLALRPFRARGVMTDLLLTHLAEMFDGATCFDQLLADWKKLSVTDMDEMFDNSDCPRSRQSCFYVVV
jgi:hypothetical protein